MQFSFTTHQRPSILNQTIQKTKNKKHTHNGFEDMELPAGGSYSMWNFLE